MMVINILRIGWYVLIVIHQTTGSTSNSKFLMRLIVDFQFIREIREDADKLSFNYNHVAIVHFEVLEKRRKL
jgi:hypothetical protein